MTCALQVEINPYCTRVLKRHWPHVSRWKDVKSFDPKTVGAAPIDLICGGFPCQDLSMAGRGIGLAGERSELFSRIIRCARIINPKWLLIENVTGLLSAHGGRDMQTVLESMGKCGYKWAYRVLNSRYFGVAQHRRRVYIVGYLGSRGAAEVLFEREGLRRRPAESRRSPTIVGTLTASGAGTAGASDGDAQAGHLIAKPLLTKRRDNGGDENFVLGFQPQTLEGVRRLTPVEYERLQGFPDGWTDVSSAADGPRYRALGNAVTVPVAEWIGRRMVAYEQEERV